MSKESALVLLLGTILINIPLKKRSACLMLSFAFTAAFPYNAWWLALLELLWIDIYAKKLKCFPIRTITFDFLLMLSICIYWNEHTLHILDIFKTHAFMCYWALLFIYVKNRLLMLSKILKTIAS